MNTSTHSAAVVARVPISVRWGDLDAFDHVNNAAFLVYVQEARIVWLSQLVAQLRDDAKMPVVAAASLNFRRQLGWQPQQSFESGIEQTVRWYLDNRTWWQRIRTGVYRGDRLGVAS